MARITDPIVNVTNTISNTSVSLIQITEDKLVNILTRHVDKLKKSKEWLASLSFSVSLLLVLLTSDFRTKWGLSADTWRALFIFLFIASLGYLIYTIYNSFKHQVSVDSIMDDIKKTD